MTTIDDIRTVHMVEGSTFAAYLSYDSSYLTAGADGKVNVYPGLFDDESLSVSLESKTTALAVKDELVVLANEKHEVSSYSLPDIKLESTLLRFTAAVNHICISDDKKIVAAGASDFVIKTVSSDGNNQQTYSGHSAPVLSVNFLGLEQLVSSSCDGTVKIWNLNDQKCIKTLDLLPKTNSPPDCPGILSVCALLKKIAVPSGKSVKIICSETWKEEFALENEHKEAVSNVCWSPSGKYLATASSNGEVFCWDVTSKKCIKRYQQQESKGITSLEWKKADEVLFADEEGEFGVCEVPADETNQKKRDQFDIGDDDDILASALLEDGNADEETNDGEIFPSSAAKKSKKRPRPMDDDDDDDIEGDHGDEGDLDAPSSKKTRINNMDNFLDDQAEDDDDDEASISLNLIKEGLLGPVRKSIIDEDEDDESVASMSVQKVPSAIPVVAPVEVFMQPAFQPSSTPVHLQHRFMVWNSVGIIRCHRDDGISSIDVEFHNASTSHPLHIANVLDNSMAALSSTAVVFACKKQDDMPSKLTCTHFRSWDNNKEWSLSMNEDEDIMAIGANSSHVAVATSRGLLRMLSVGGLQTQLLYLPGSVVSVAMHEREMVIVYHKSAGYKKCQCLGVTQYQYKKFNWKISSDETLSLQSNVTVVWLGYSSEGTPCIVLSSGDVLLFHRTQQSWMVVGNTKDQVKNKSDNYWVIGIEEKQAQMRCIYCKGANFPALLPRPIPTFIGFQFPLCEITTEKSKKEHELMKNNLLQSNMSYSLNSLRLPVDHNVEVTERQQIQLLMQLFALACKADREFRAVEICKLMPSAESIGLAIQYASKMRRMNIAKRLTELAQNRAAEEEEEEEQGEGDEIESDGEQFINLSDLSDEEPEILETKHSTPAVPKRPQVNGRRLQQSAKPKQPLETRGESEDEEEEELSEEETNSEQPSQQKSSQIESSAPKLRLSGNPFKVSQRNSSQQKNSAAKGTDYFEKLESQKLSKTKQIKKNVNEAVKKKQNKITTMKTKTINNKKKNESAKENIDFNVVGKEQQTPLTGFQLFLKKQQVTKSDDDEEEDFVPIAMRMWKELSSDEKKEWNAKAKGGQQGSVIKSTQQIKDSKNINNNNNNVTSDGIEKQKVEPKTKTVSTKSKLSSFAFQKS